MSQRDIRTGLTHYHSIDTSTISFQKMFAKHEEYSEYENIFTGNVRAQTETQSLNKRIMELVAETFKKLDYS